MKAVTRYHMVKLDIGLKNTHDYVKLVKGDHSVDDWLNHKVSAEIIPKFHTRPTQS